MSDSINGNLLLIASPSGIYHRDGMQAMDVLSQPTAGYQRQQLVLSLLRNG